MWWAITYRVIASVVTFLIGLAVFAIKSPPEEVRLPPSTRQIKAITLSRETCVDAERKCSTFTATFRSNGTCSYIAYTDSLPVARYMGEFNPQDLTYLIEQINQQISFELPLTSPASSVKETTSIEAVASDGTSFVATYNGAALPLDVVDCNLY